MNNETGGIIRWGKLCFLAAMLQFCDESSKGGLLLAHHCPMPLEPAGWCTEMAPTPAHTLRQPNHTAEPRACGPCSLLRVETQIPKHRSAHHQHPSTTSTQTRAQGQIQHVTRSSYVLRPRRAREESSPQTTPSLYHLGWMEGQDFGSLERKTAVCQDFIVWELSQPNTVHTPMAPWTSWNSKRLQFLVSLMFLNSSIIKYPKKEAITIHVPSPKLIAHR